MRNAVRFITGRRELNGFYLLRGSEFALLSPGIFLIIRNALFYDIEWLDLILEFYKPIIIMVVLSIVPLLLMGIPLILLLRRWNALCWLTVCLGAAAVGFLFPLVISFLAIGLSNISALVGLFLVGAAWGLASGLGFCIGAKFYSSSTLKNKDPLAA